MEIELTLKGTAKEIKEQIDGLIAYCGEQAKVKEVAENEKNPKSKINTDNIHPIFKFIVKGFFING